MIKKGRRRIKVKELFLIHSKAPLSSFHNVRLFVVVSISLVWTCFDWPLLLPIYEVKRACLYNFFFFTFLCFSLCLLFGLVSLFFPIASCGVGVCIFLFCHRIRSSVYLCFLKKEKKKAAHSSHFHSEFSQHSVFK